MTTNRDEERMKLAEKLDADLEAFVETKLAEQRPRVEDEDNRSIDEIAAELNEHPAFMSQFDASQPMSAAMEGLQALKYESDSQQDNALSYKDDGNENFKRKKYRWAVQSYSQGLACRCDDRALNAVLHANRAAAQYRLGNFRSALEDCTAARKFKADHMKAIVRGAECCLQLKRYSELLEWCRAGLLINTTDATLLLLKTKADKLKKLQDRDARKHLSMERKKEGAEGRLRGVIKDHGVKLAPGHGRTDDLQPAHPSGRQVQLCEDGSLCWSVLFIYPEHSESDCITAFEEQASFSVHLDVMFPSRGASDGESPSWDVEHKYRTENIQIYFEDSEKETLYTVEPTATLGETLKHARYFVTSGTPRFLLVVKQSSFADHLTSQYRVLATDSGT